MRVDGGHESSWQMCVHPSIEEATDDDTDAAAERHATNSFDRATLLVALELSRSRWLITSPSPRWPEAAQTLPKYQAQPWKAASAPSRGLLQATFRLFSTLPGVLERARSPSEAGKRAISGERKAT